MNQNLFEILLSKIESTKKKRILAGDEKLQIVVDLLKAIASRKGLNEEGKKKLKSQLEFTFKKDLLVLISNVNKFREFINQKTLKAKETGKLTKKDQALMTYGQALLN